MIQTQTFKAIRTQSGKWCKWDHDAGTWTDRTDHGKGPTLHDRLHHGDVERAESDIETPCTIVDVSLVDPRYLDALVKFHALMAHKAFFANNEAQLVSVHIDRLRAEGGT